MAPWKTDGDRRHFVMITRSLACLLLVGIGCCCFGCTSHSRQATIGSRAAADRKAAAIARVLDGISQVAPWGMAYEYTREDWFALLGAATTIQQTSPVYVAEGILVYQRKVADSAEPSINTDTRIFLLLRTAFDVPESVPADERPMFIGWLNWPEPDSNGNVSVAWPLSWAGGVPRFIDEQLGSQGAGYGGMEEYEFFLLHYPYRDLEAVRKRLQEK